MGDIGSGVTKVLSVATEVPAKISSIARDFELDVGTRKVSVHLGGEPKQLWPPDVDVENIPDAVLPSDVNKTIRGIIDKLKAAATFNLGSVVDLLISLAVCSTCAVIGLGIMLHFPSRYWILLFFAALILSGLACGSFWFLYHFLNRILSVGSELLKVDVGPAVGNALLSFQISAAQGVLSLLLCFFSIVNRRFRRPSQPHGMETKCRKSSLPSREMTEHQGREHGAEAAPSRPNIRVPATTTQLR